jgi:hypothetical protein
MIGLFAFGLRVLLLAGFTFGFVVLFEHGPQGFAAGAPVEANKFVAFVTSLMNKQAPEPAPDPEPPPAAPAPAPAAPAPAPTQPATSAATPKKPDAPPSAWEQLQSRPIGEGMDAPIGASTNGGSTN